MTHATEVTMPPGADPESDDWFTDQGVTQRLVWSRPIPLPEHLATNDIRVVVVQRTDGTIINIKGDDEPLVYHGCSDYTIDDARTIAQGLLDAADLADTWAGRPDSVDTAMIAAHRAVRTAYTLLRTAPGNAGDYLRAALDSLTDATEAIR